MTNKAGPLFDIEIGDEDARGVVYFRGKCDFTSLDLFAAFALAGLISEGMTDTKALHSAAYDIAEAVLAEKQTREAKHGD